MQRRIEALIGDSLHLVPAPLGRAPAIGQRVLWLWRNLSARLFMANTSEWNKAPEGQAKPQGSSARRAGALQGLGTHHIRLVLQARVVVDRRGAHLKVVLNPALALLHHVPGLMGQVRVLAGRQMGGAKGKT